MRDIIKLKNLTVQASVHVLESSTNQPLLRKQRIRFQFDIADTVEDPLEIHQKLRNKAREVYQQSLNRMRTEDTRIETQLQSHSWWIRVADFLIAG